MSRTHHEYVVEDDGSSSEAEEVSTAERGGEEWEATEAMARTVVEAPVAEAAWLAHEWLNAEWRRGAARNRAAVLTIQCAGRRVLARKTQLERKQAAARARLAARESEERMKR